jgi:putative RecB family exonuclease
MLKKDFKGKVIRLSSTRIHSFLDCKYKYWANYYTDYPKVPNPAFKLGLACHECLELAGNIWMEKGKFTKSDIKKIMNLYDKVSIREGIIDMEIHMEGKELISKRLDNFDTGGKIIGLELKFGFDGNDFFTDFGVPLMGAIDKIIELDEETLLIVDYKTSKTAPTTNQLKTDIQLSLYDLVAHKLWPGYKRIILSLDVLKSEMVYSYRTDAEREEFNNYLVNLYEEMLDFNEESIKQDLNIFCPWCDFKEYCSSYKEACNKSDYKFLSMTNTPDIELYNEWEKIKNTIKILEMREKEISSVLIEKIKREQQNINLGEKELIIRQSSRTNYNTKDISDIVPHSDFIGLVNINKKAVDNYVEVNPVVKEAVEKASYTNYTSPFLATKKIKK